MIDTSARLISVSYSGSLGAVQTTETATTILCTLNSVNRTEYYKAYDSGFKPEFRLETDPVNYAGQSVVDVDTPDGTVRCDIYRTYRKAQDVLELWCVKKNPDAVQTFTLWTAGKTVVLFGCYLDGEDGIDRTETGSIATDRVKLILPKTFQAFSGGSPVTYCRPKAYAAMSAANKATHFTIDARDFFALGQIAATGAEKYQAVNAAHDDVYVVQSIARKHKMHPDSEFLEVIGR